MCEKYNGNGGIEYFISFESDDERLIYGFCRLRISDRAGEGVFPELVGAALVRELHVYGQLIPTYSDSLTGDSETGKRGKIKKDSQHLGFGRRLMRHAEKLALKHRRKRIAVIAGIGTGITPFGYRLAQEGGFLVKRLWGQKELSNMLWRRLFSNMSRFDCKIVSFHRGVSASK